MADIVHDLPIRAPIDAVFRAVSTPGGLDTWWTERSAGDAREGGVFDLWFGPEYHWRAQVTRCVPATRFELQMVQADDDWSGTRVGVELEPRNGSTWVRFYHVGWPDANEHYRISCNCWALYLRVLRRFLEHGERVPYADRLDA